MISFENINIKYEKLIVDDVSLSIEEGQFISIIGPSGCGKSSILKYIINNSNEKTIGYMAQDDLLLEWYNVEQNILLALKINDIKINIDHYLEIFGLLEYKKYNISDLSGGLKSRVALLRAYLVSKRLMLLDEPFSKLDYITHLKLMKWVKSVVNGKSIFLVTHNIEEAIFLSDKIVVLSERPCSIVAEYNVSDYDDAVLKEIIIDSLKI